MNSFWTDKKVLLTGHTGFKGAWMTLLLKSLGARVYGYALPAEKNSLYRQLDLKSELDGEMLADIGNPDAFWNFYHESRPDVTIHMAAQALVLPSYHNPVETHRVNIIGTANLIDTIRLAEKPQICLIVTSDKVYENEGAGRAFVEGDRLGGIDPYSASKAAAEIVTASFAQAYGAELAQKGIRLVTGRAGNVIGAGDRSAHRLVPDVVHALETDTPLQLRYPHAVRPWQHVLEPLSGYLRAIEWTAQQDSYDYNTFNFGPELDNCQTVSTLYRTLAELWGKDVEAHAPGAHNPHEASLLHLDSSKAREVLGWKPRWGFEETLTKVAEGYKNPSRDTLLAQIDAYYAADKLGLRLVKSA